MAMNVVLLAVCSPFFSGCVSEAVKLSGAVGRSLRRTENENVRAFEGVE